MSEKKKLLISFSGGKTSGYMLWWLLNEWEDRANWETVVVFANTGKEAEGTLFFVDECSQEFGVDITWVEAKSRDDNGNLYSEKGWAVKHKVVDYETASRNGEPFEEVISILGIPSTNAPFCSPQLKRFPIESFLEELGWKDYYTAIGIRADEKNRLPKLDKKGFFNKKFYPLASIQLVSKADITNWWKTQSFNLDIHPDEGNCDNCWKKDLNRLCRNATRNLKSFDWWQQMTDKYGQLNPRETELSPPFNFYRGNISPADIIKAALNDERQMSLFDVDEPYNSCNESCEAF